MNSKNLGVIVILLLESRSNPSFEAQGLSCTLQTNDFPFAPCMNTGASSSILLCVIWTSCTFSLLLAFTRFCIPTVLYVPSTTNQSHFQVSRRPTFGRWTYSFGYWLCLININFINVCWEFCKLSYISQEANDSGSIKLIVLTNAPMPLQRRL